MPSAYSRSKRVAEQIRQELADMLWRDVHDPRVKGVTLTSVEVSSDLEHAKVWFTTMPGSNLADIQKGLQRASGFMRRDLGQRMRLRMVPTLTFQHDESIARGAHLSQLIDNAIAEDLQHQHNNDSKPD